MRRGTGCQVTLAARAENNSNGVVERHTLGHSPATLRARSLLSVM